MVLCGISTCFQVLSPCMRQITHALLTRSPLSYIRASSPVTPFDLHVLSTPPAFVLSQDQTLVFNPQSGLLVQHQPQIKTHSRINCRFSSYLCIVFKVLRPPEPPFQALSRERLIILSQPPDFVNTFFKVFFTFFEVFLFFSFSRTFDTQASADVRYFPFFCKEGRIERSHLK